MENKEQIIEALCTMYGAGYRGPVGFEFRLTKDSEWVENKANLSPVFISWQFKGRSYWVDGIRNIHIPTRPFSALMEKDESGVCDAERLCKIVKPTWTPEKIEMRRSYVRAEYKGGTYITIHNNSKFITAWVEHNRIGIDNYPGAVDFIRSKAYEGFIPEVLKGGNDG